jgi:SAM-dependent methyltransferase
MALSYHGVRAFGAKNPTLPRYREEMAQGTAGFDRIARPYRWLEYLALGPLLQRTRVHFLPQLQDRRRAIVMGDGDGRFLAELLRGNPKLVANAVDTSEAMLGLLARRTDPARVTTHLMSALDFTPSGPVDLIATHFFLDCLTQDEVDALCLRLAGRLAPGGLWVVSDFRIPAGPMHWPARLYVGMLYRVFGLLTGITVRRLPDFASALTAAGLTRMGVRYRLFGLLTSELWSRERLANPVRAVDGRGVTTRG